MAKESQVPPFTRLVIFFHDSRGQQCDTRMNELYRRLKVELDTGPL